MDMNVLELFHPVIKEWFEKNIGKPSPPQIEGWPAIGRGENVLITAPTGAGKTLAAFLECINDLFVKEINDELEPGVQVLYISPLKALNNDIYRNLEVPLKGIEALCTDIGIKLPNITKAVRTGDTTQSERRKMLKKPPHILITTPESLYLILTSKNSWTMLKNVKYLIVDEIHTLLGNKRGAHLSLSIERLAHLVEKPIIRIGLSATVRPLEEAAKYLGGFYKGRGNWIQRPVTIIEPKMEKHIDLKISMPVKDYRVLKEGTVWNDIYKRIYEMVLEHRSTIVFVNNRAIAEKVSANLNNISGHVIAKTHHGCISKEARLEVEKQLKKGELPCLVATSSLELGIDIGAIDLMIQVTSPKSAARGLQRLGRAGHRMNSVSKGRIIPKTRGDLLEASIISREMLEHNIEEEWVLKNPLDVLSQHIVSMSCIKEWNIEEMRDLFMSSYSYQEITIYEVEKILEMLSGDYEHSEDSPRSPMIIWDRISRVVRGDAYSRMLAVSGTGTIPDRGYYPVYLEDRKTRLGELDETFIYEARLGDRFMLGTSPWKIDRIEKDRVIVSPCSSAGAKTPFWTGEGLGRPYELGIRFGKYLSELSKRAGTEEFIVWLQSSIPIDEAGGRNLEQYIIDQRNEIGCISSDSRIVVEYFSDEAGETRIVIHSHFGGRVNEGLAILMEYVLSRALHIQAQSSSSDDGILINLMGCTEYPRNIFSLIKPEEISNILVDILPGTPLFSITFRHNASRALMMGTKKFGKRSPLWIQRVRAMELLQLAEKHPDHPLIIETYRECMNTILDVPHIIEVVENIASRDIEIVEKVTSHPSPFTAELLFNFMGVAMYEGLLPNPKRSEQKLITGKVILSHDRKSNINKKLIDKQAILDIVVKNSPLSKRQSISSPDQLHSFMLTYGDIDINEEGSAPQENIYEHVKTLKSQGRAISIDFRENTFAAAEEYSMYCAAMGINETKAASGDSYENPWTQEEALYRIVRRYARYNSPFTEEIVGNRYSVNYELLNRVLQRLQQDGVLSKGIYGGSDKEEWYHSLIIEKIRLHTMYMARKASNAVGQEYLGDFLPRWQGVGSEILSPVENLYEVILKLRGLYLPVEWWEDFVFPSRIKGYRKSHIDKLCASGRVAWRVKSGEGSPKLAWFRTEDLKEDELKEESEKIKFLTFSEAEVYKLLKRKGASFIHSLQIGTGMSTPDILNALEGLVWKGVAVNDSYESIRYFQAESGTNPKAKAKRRATAFKTEMGRWEIAQEIIQLCIEEYIELLLKRYGFISKEIFQYEKTLGLWKDAYELLKQWEYIGKVSRGYYIEGLSGMQFILPEVTHMLNQPSDKYLVLNSCDPAQLYGQIAPRDLEKSSWICTPGTTVVIKSGKPVLIVEAYGERIKSQTNEKAEIVEAFQKFIEAFNSGSIWPSNKRIKIKYINDEASTKSFVSDELYKLDFVPEMMDMVYWKSV